MPGDRKQPHALIPPGAAVGFAGLVAVLALAARSADYQAPGFATAIPVGGLAVLWFLLRGVRPVSVESAALIAVCFACNLVGESGVAFAAVFAATALLQTLIAAALLRRWCGEVWGCGGDRPLDRPRMLAPYGAALALAMLAGALLSVLGALAVDGELQALPGLLWLGRNLCSSLIVVTFGLLLGQRIASPGPRASLLGDAGWAELVAATVFTVTMYSVAFSFDDLPVAFPLLAATVWFGLRLSTLLTAAHSFVAGVTTMALTMGGIGPFGAVDRVDVGYLLAEFYVATIVITGLGLSTGRDERQALAVELRRTQEEAVYQASVRDTVIGSMTEGLFVLDDRGGLLVHNLAAAEIFGLQVDAVSWRELAERSGFRADGSVLPDAERPSARALAGEAIHDAELLVRRPDGVDRIVGVSAIPLPRDDVLGRARAMVLFRDISHEHARRAELASFAGVVAHDLRNPLAAIDGWTEMIAEELDGGGLDHDLAREFVSRVRSSSGRMRELIGDLLAHATSSSRDLVVARVDVRVLVEEVATAREAQGVVSAEPVPPVLADPVLLRQVLDNLIGNALKYVAPGVEPKVAVRGFASGGEMVTVQVSDNGIGIPAGEREKIFEEFHRAHFRDYEGSGLGLSIVRRIITRHDGSVVARTNPAGQGSVFEFTLPAYAG
jgi:signal transduction histidine kinase